MANENHDAQGRFSNGGDSGSHGTGTTHTGNAGISADHQAEAKAIADHVHQTAMERARQGDPRIREKDAELHRQRSELDLEARMEAIRTGRNPRAQ